MFVPSSLAMLALSLSAAALPTDSSSTINPVAVGSTVDYSSIAFQPLQDSSTLNLSGTDPILGGMSTLRRRQDIDFDLVDSTPDPTISPNNYTDYNQQAAIAAVVADVSSDPLPQRRDVTGDAVMVSTTPGGYSKVVIPGTAAINAPLNCNGADTFIGSRLFSSGPFDESLCAAVCTAQSNYNLKHPPSSGLPKTCQFYNTYVLFRDGVPQGQYCSLYTQAWAASYATNTGQWRGTAHYTIQQSVSAANATNSGDVSCPSDVPYLLANGGAFCSAYLSYVPPTSTIATTVTPATSIVTSIETDYATETDYSTSFSTSVTLTTTTTTIQRRDLQIPVSAVSWSPSRLSKACSAVATGSTTITFTQTAATPLTTLLTTQSATTTTTEPTALVVMSTSTIVVVSSPTLGANLVQNPSFEQANSGVSHAIPDWSSTQFAYRNSYPMAAYDGTAYVVLRSNLGAQSGAITQSTAGLSTSSQYTLSYHYFQLSGKAGVCNVIVSLGGIVVSYFISQAQPEPSYSHPVYNLITVQNITPAASTQDLVITAICNLTANIIVDAIALQQQLYTGST